MTAPFYTTARGHASTRRRPATAFLDVIHATLKDDARARKTAELDAAGISGEARDKALIDAEGLANDAFQQCRTLYNQLNLSATMRELLPHGLFGLFALLLFLAMLSTDDSRIYSATLTIAQDVVLPFRKRPFTPRQHIWMVRIVAMSIGVFFLAGSYYMKQLDYYQMFNTLACTMWIGASGSIMIFGLYSRFGTTWGAQSTFAIPPDETTGGRWIAMFDLWRPDDAIDGRYAWLPADFRDNRIEIAWRDTFPPAAE